ncbi:acyltransferase family protein [Spirosoma validum]|uniref:Acyltransferase n=1 Tax=Spirosoma validum TaxID=2771355 RepID=A0A927AYX7_9BACT|nr:acyltransferase [Spirosoma validum]MBD2752298.1 acyltransferase [Spirosoma validum]
MESELRVKPIRYHEIDLLRFIAAFVVLMYHYVFRGYNHDQLSPVNYPFLGSIFKYGYLGVELFFIISGYVVLMSAYHKNVREFFVSRVVRLYPAFWIACTLCFGITYLFAPLQGQPGWSVYLDVHPRQYLVNLTMLHYFFGYGNIDGVYWTLTYEIVFYFLISLLIGYDLVKHLPLLLAVWLVYCGVVGFKPMGSASAAPFATLFFPAYAPYFVGGMLFYMIQQRLGNRRYLLILLIISWALGVRSALAESREYSKWFGQPFSPEITAILVTLLFSLFLLIIFRKIDLHRYTGLVWLGTLTYPLYLLHHNIGFILYQRIGNTVDKYVLLIGITGFMIVLSYVLHMYIEKPLSQFLKRKLVTVFKHFDKTIPIEHVY